MSAKEYWSALYKDNMDACVVRVYHTSYDFLTELRKHPELFHYILTAKSMIEFGCGTGDMGRLTGLVNPGIDYYGIDLSDTAIRYANERYKKHGLYYQVRDLFAVNERFDVAYSSNTLEHFKDPYKFIDQLLKLAEVVFVLVPYNETLRDGYDEEGGAGHVFSFTEESFSRYKVLGSFTYFTHTWVVGDKPLQLAIALTK